MAITNMQEIQENGLVYIVNTYDNGTVEKYLKPDENTSESTPPPVTNEDLMNKLNDMSGEQMSKASLDAAYREGVNEYQ